jgi:hypothetical protein
VIERRIVIRRVVDETESSIDVLDRVFERKLEEAALKLFAKVFDKKTMEELEERDIAHLLQEPVIFFEVDGETERVATSESDGRDTSTKSKDPTEDIERELDGKLADELKEKFEESGLEVSAGGLVTPKKDK